MVTTTTTTRLIYKLCVPIVIVLRHKKIKIGKTKKTPHRINGEGLFVVKFYLVAAACVFR